jgi:hypothetical protein
MPVATLAARAAGNWRHELVYASEIEIKAGRPLTGLEANQPTLMNTFYSESVQHYLICHGFVR